MEARHYPLTTGVAAGLANVLRRLLRGPLRALTVLLAIGITSGPTARTATAQFGMARQYVAHSENFIVFGSDPKWAAQVASVAEQHRRELAKYWLGRELPTWPQRCPVHVHSAPSQPASGETRYSISGGMAGGWAMIVNGTPQRILDSVLPHEITHTIFATHFARLNKYMPRWADEGACTTVEHESEKRKHVDSLQRFLRSGRGLAFNQMLRLKEYPDDILPLYAQGHSAVQFLLDQGGPSTFMAFVETGMRTENWADALRRHYEYTSVGQFQTLWNKWLADGQPESLIAYAPKLQGSEDPVRLAAAQPAGPKVQSAGATVTLAANQSADIGNGKSYYLARVRQTGAETEPVQLSNNSAAPPVANPLIGGWQASHPQPMQSTEIQVLDWGNSLPAPAGQSVPLQPADRTSLAEPRMQLR